MRIQYHFRPGPTGPRAWDVQRLVERSAHLTPRLVPLASIRELDEPYWFGDQQAQPTCREVAEHARLIDEADLAFPVILSSDGRVMDGMHRIAKALLQGQSYISAVQFLEDPAPDYVDVLPDDLPY